MFLNSTYSAASVNPILADSAGGVKSKRVGLAPVQCEDSSRLRRGVKSKLSALSPRPWMNSSRLRRGVKSKPPPAWLRCLQPILADSAGG